ncbi:MAG: cyclase family protein [Planctomycetota bacterium]
MKILDVTVPFRPGMFFYPGEVPFEIRKKASFATGQTWNGSIFSTSCHNGTHLDAPYHYFDKGKRLDDLDLASLMGPCDVVEVKAKASIEAADIPKRLLRKGARILFKTRNSPLMRKKEFRQDYTYVAASAATTLAKAKVALVGVDYLSAEQFGITEDPAHKTILGAGIPLLEGVDLSKAKPGRYEIVCAPMHIAEADAAPARVWLIIQ